MSEPPGRIQWVPELPKPAHEHELPDIPVSLPGPNHRNLLKILLSQLILRNPALLNQILSGLALPGSDMNEIAEIRAEIFSGR